MSNNIEIEVAEMKKDITYLKTEQDKQSSKLDKIDRKLDSYMEVKADKQEVNLLRIKVNKLTEKIMFGLIATLLAMTAFLLRETLFK